MNTILYTPPNKLKKINKKKTLRSFLDLFQMVIMLGIGYVSFRKTLLYFIIAFLVVKQIIFFLTLDKEQQTINNMKNHVLNFLVSFLFIKGVNVWIILILQFLGYNLNIDLFLEKI